MSTPFQSLLRPAMRWMDRTRVPLKMLLMGGLLLLPMLWFGGLLLRQETAALQATRLQAQGARDAMHLQALIAQVQLHRSATQRAGTEDPASHRALAQALAAVEQARGGSPLLAQALGPDWKATREQLATMAADHPPLPRQDNLARHAAWIESLRLAMVDLDSLSGLAVDPQPDTSLLVDLITRDLLPWSEQIARLHALGMPLLARGETSAGDRATMLGRTEALASLQADLQRKGAAMQRAGVTEPAAWATALPAAQALEARTREIFSAQVLETSPEDYDRLGAAALTAGHAVAQQAGERLLAALDDRAAALSRGLVLQLALSLSAVVLILYLSLAFYRSFMGGLQLLHRGVHATADGDLASTVQMKGRDELASIGQAVDGMAARLSAMVADIRSSAVRVGLAGRQVAQASESLSSRTHAQAASLRQTTDTVGQLSRAVSVNAGAAQALDQLTAELRQQAEHGGAAMRDTVQRMAELETSSRRVAEIIGVIDGIAFQTNILALNAAVEAARAGDAGRGFAVVAAEVRQLALRSSTASAEIRGLIQQSGQQVTESVGRIQQVGGTLDAVVDGVRDVAERLRQIAQASAQQSAGLEEVSRSVAHLDELTKQNAQMVEDSSAAAEDLVTRAAALSHAVGAIRLRQGSADEATAMVERAMALVKQRGLARAAEEFRRADGPFRDRDLYIFVTDREGRYHVHGAKPAMEGKRVHEVPGIDGDRFARESWAATQGSHWVEYSIINPENGEVQPKASHVQALDERLLLGCGIYRTVAQATG